MNLCTNAIHAMKETGGTLDIATASFLHRHRVRSAYPALAPGRYLRISVRDTGTGMDEATIERVFEPFFTTKASGEGTGMGLAVVHGIVSSLKGAISVESKLGVGSVFHVVLPLVERLQADEEESAAPMPTGRETILFVDDERDIVKMQTHMLTTLGYNPVMANSAEEALRLFALNPDRFDLIITDQVMPGMSGTELAKAILGIRPNMPIILSTGFSDVVTPEQARALGVREFMLKPVVMRHMAETIRRALSTTAPAPTAPAQT
jgi:CheY-like chemotaxis protein/anti-sigma regulatory factor (Ser/Thr protein kinase)